MSKFKDDSIKCVASDNRRFIMTITPDWLYIKDTQVVSDWFSCDMSDEIINGATL